MQKKYILFFILAFLFFFQTLPVLAQGPQCVYCGTALDNSNVGARTERGYLCRNCYIKLSNMQNGGNRQQQAQPQQQPRIYKCSTCGQIIKGKGGTDGTNYYCASCLAKLQGNDVLKGELTCDNCHRKIGPTEQYAKGQDGRGNNVIYCVGCAQRAGLSKTIKCVKCNQVIQGAGYKAERDKYGNFIYTCAKCATDNNRFYGSALCSVCNKPIGDAGDKYYYTNNNKPYCITCKEKYKDRCKTCGLPIPEGQGTRVGTWLTCKYCSSDIIVTDEQLQQLFAQACAFMRGTLGLNVPVPPQNVSFSDMSEMRENMNKSRSDGIPRSYGQNPIGIYTHGKNTIKVQRGMEKLQILSTLVHESAHGCMAHFGYQQRPSLEYSEGFARWCSYKYLSSIGETQYYMRIARDEDRIYGDGLRKMLELENKMTANGLLDYVYTHNDFPKE